jgi:hypothetical protein
MQSIAWKGRVVYPSNNMKSISTGMRSINEKSRYPNAKPARLTK